jgi:hypothetical protein
LSYPNYCCQDGSCPDPSQGLSCWDCVGSTCVSVGFPIECGEIPTCASLGYFDSEASCENSCL